MARKWDWTSPTPTKIVTQWHKRYAAIKAGTPGHRVGRGRRGPKSVFGLGLYMAGSGPAGCLEHQDSTLGHIFMLFLLSDSHRRLVPIWKVHCYDIVVLCRAQQTDGSLVL